MRKQREQVSLTTAKTVWWQGNRYDILGEDGRILPLGGRLLPRESKSGQCGAIRMMPYIKLGSCRGTMVEECGARGSMSPPLRGQIEPTRN